MTDWNPDELNQRDASALKEMAEWWRERDDSGGSANSLTRRKMLGLAAGSLAGAAGAGGYVTGQASAGTESVGQIGTQSEPADAYVEDLYDHNGNNALSLPGDGSVSIGELSPDQSFRAGSTVHYDPRNRGPYVDLTDAVADVPSGGELHLAPTDIDITTEGRVFAEKPISVRGDYGRAETGERVGTQLVNTGTPVDAPVIEIATPDTSANPGWIERVEVAGVYVQQGASQPGLLTDGAIRVLIRDSEINVSGSGPHAIKVANDGFFSRIIRCYARGGTTSQIELSGNGFGHSVQWCLTNGGTAGASGVRVNNVPYARIIGGQHNINASDGSGVRFVNNSGSATYGGVVDGVVAENGRDAVDINSGGSSQFREVTVRNLVSTDPDTVTFGQSRGSKAWFPINNGSGDIAVWSDTSSFDGIIVGRRGARRTISVSSSAFEPYKMLVGSFSNSQLSSVTTHSNLSTYGGYALTENGLPWHDGTDWYVAGGSTFTP